jgi:glycerol-3-phosphate acyltransferase PlsY
MGLALAALLGYTFGSLPLYRWFGALQGSPPRPLAPFPTFLVGLLDAFKGLIAVASGEAVAHDPHLGLLAGVLAVWGDCFSIWLLGQGSKGWFTAAGVLLALRPLLLGEVGLLLALFLALTRNFRWAGFLAALGIPVILAANLGSVGLAFGLGLALPIAWRHYSGSSRVFEP